MNDVVITAGVRTPIGNFGGALKNVAAVELGGVAMRGAWQRAQIEPEQIDEVWVGHARQAGNGPNPGKLAAAEGGIPFQVPATTIQMACLSSMQATILGYKSIALEDADCVMVAGMEHMSSIPYLNTAQRWGQKSGDVRLVDGLTRDGFLDPLTQKLMGEIADTYSDRWQITREEQDELAAQSHQYAAKAIESGSIAPILVPVKTPSSKPSADGIGDEHVRPQSNVDTLSHLRPAFNPQGTVTAGNASAVTDGAAAIVLMSQKAAQNCHLKPLARIVSYAVTSTDPKDYGVAPVSATQEALRRAGLQAADIDIWEINEAFAVQVIAVTRLLGMDWHHMRLNVWGGAIALGHPVGMSGVRIVLHAAHALALSGGHYAVATICGNGGQGATVVIERAG